MGFFLIYMIACILFDVMVYVLKTGKAETPVARGPTIIHPAEFELRWDWEHELWWE